MATKKTTTTKKKAPAKKTAAKRTTAKKVTKKAPVVQSFKPCKDQQPFFTFKITTQTIYWTIIAVISIAFVVWVYKVQSDIDDLYRQIDQIQSIDHSEFTQKEIKKSKNR